MLQCVCLVVSCCPSVNSDCCSFKAKIHYTSFPVESPQQVGDLTLASLQHKRQVRNQLAWAKVRCVCCVVSFPKFRHVIL